MAQAVAAFTTNCAGKLRKENTCAKVLHLFVQTNIHRKQDAQYFQSLDVQLPVPSNSSTELVRASMEALDKIWRPGYQYGKAGVMMLDLVPASTVQMNLFTQQKKKKDAQLMKTLDDVNKSFGRDVVRFGVQDYGTNWKLRQEHLSQRFTTRLDQLPKAQ